MTAHDPPLNSDIPGAPQGKFPGFKAGFERDPIVGYVPHQEVETKREQSPGAVVLTATDVKIAADRVSFTAPWNIPPKLKELHNVSGKDEHVFAKLQISFKVEGTKYPLVIEKAIVIDVKKKSFFSVLTSSGSPGPDGCGAYVQVVNNVPACRNTDQSEARMVGSFQANSRAVVAVVKQAQLNTERHFQKLRADGVANSLNSYLPPRSAFPVCADFPKDTDQQRLEYAEKRKKLAYDLKDTNLLTNIMTFEVLPLHRILDKDISADANWEIISETSSLAAADVGAAADLVDDFDDDVELFESPSTSSRGGLTRGSSVQRNLFEDDEDEDDDRAQSEGESESEVEDIVVMARVDRGLSPEKTISEEGAESVVSIAEQVHSGDLDEQSFVHDNTTVEGSDQGGPHEAEDETEGEDHDGDDSKGEGEVVSLSLLESPATEIAVDLNTTLTEDSVVDDIAEDNSEDEEQVVVEHDVVEPAPTSVAEDSSVSEVHEDDVEELRDQAEVVDESPAEESEEQVSETRMEAPEVQSSSIDEGMSTTTAPEAVQAQDVAESEETVQKEQAIDEERSDSKEDRGQQDGETTEEEEEVAVNDTDAEDIDVGADPPDDSQTLETEKSGDAPAQKQSAEATTSPSKSATGVKAKAKASAKTAMPSPKKSTSTSFAAMTISKKKTTTSVATVNQQKETPSKPKKVTRTSSTTAGLTGSTDTPAKKRVSRSASTVSSATTTPKKRPSSALKKKQTSATKLTASSAKSASPAASPAVASPRSSTPNAGAPAKKATKGKGKRKLPTPKWHTVTQMPTVDFKVGDKVSIENRTLGPSKGIVHFMGMVEFGAGPWVGVELLERPGKHDGSKDGVRYYTCPEGTGMFVRPDKVKPSAN